MAGLILLAALAALIGFLTWLSGLIARKLPVSTGWKTLLRVVIVVGAFPLMLIDEIIGKFQFEALCEANGIESVDVSKARYKKVKGEYGRDEFVGGTVMPIEESDVFFRDAENNELLFQYKNYYASGGWLMRYTSLSMGHSRPILFSGNGCGLLRKDQIFKANQISQIN